MPAVASRSKNLTLGIPSEISSASIYSANKSPGPVADRCPRVDVTTVSELKPRNFKVNGRTTNAVTTNHHHHRDRAASSKDR